MGGAEVGNLVVSPAATLRPLGCAQGRAVGSCGAGFFLARLKPCPTGVGGPWGWARAVALSRDAHLSDDEAVAKMGHPDLWWDWDSAPHP